MFYGLRLLSATRAFRVDCRVKLIGVSLEEVVVVVVVKAGAYGTRW